MRKRKRKRKRKRMRKRMREPQRGTGETCETRVLAAFGFPVGLDCRPSTVKLDKKFTACPLFVSRENGGKRGSGEEGTCIG
jgi:hypothetical protein